MITPHLYITNGISCTGHSCFFVAVSCHAKASSFIIFFITGQLHTVFIGRACLPGVKLTVCCFPASSSSSAARMVGTPQAQSRDAVANSPAPGNGDTIMSPRMLPTTTVVLLAVVLVHNLLAASSRYVLLLLLVAACCCGSECCCCCCCCYCSWYAC